MTIYIIFNSISIKPIKNEMLSFNCEGIEKIIPVSYLFYFSCPVEKTILYEKAIFCNKYLA